jgi:hypothetical protein
MNQSAGWQVPGFSPIVSFYILSVDQGQTNDTPHVSLKDTNA